MNRPSEKDRTPQTFDEWWEWYVTQHRERFNILPEPTIGSTPWSAGRWAWDAALASQQAIITDAANQIDDMQAQLADAKAEIDRLYKEVEGHIELYVESNLRREWAEAELRAAREVVDEARKYVALVWDPHDPKAESWAFNRLKTLTDRLATSEDKG